jgi:5-methylcytosine-specific restriction endonuclease McrA
MKWTQGQLPTAKWVGAYSTRARARLRPMVEAGAATCSICALPIAPDALWDIDHLTPRDIDPSLTHDPDNQGVAHRRCNRSRGAVYGNTRRRRLAAIAKGETP